MKNVLITGGSRGIGEECVREFSKNGYRVFFSFNKSFDKAKRLCYETGAISYKADVSDFISLKEMVDSIHKNYGRVNILINNAGIAEQKLFSDITADDWDRMFDVNIKGMFYITKLILPDMIHEKYGKIVNVSSIWGISGASCEVHYSASKAAVIGFTKALAKEVGLSGINVNCVAPGVIDTDMNLEIDDEIKKELAYDTPLNRLGTALDVAKTIYFLSTDDTSFITGQVISPNGGIVI